MAAREVISDSEEKTMAIAAEFGRQLKPGTVVALEGDLGSGKTTFVKGVAAGLGLQDKAEVKSPTFALVHIYETRPRLYHLDLYRLETPKEIQSMGIEEILSDPESVVCIEWAERAAAFLPPECRRIRFENTGPASRRITFA